MDIKGGNLTKHRKNIAVLGLLIAIAVTGLLGRLAFLMILRSEHYSKMALELHQRERSIKAARGRILDTKGKVIADNRTVCTVSVIYNQVKDREKVAEELSSLLGIDKEAVRKKVEKRSVREIIKTNVDKETGDAVRRLKLSGVKVDEDYKRYYPYGSLASKVLGFTGGDNQGVIGLEVEYDPYLKGTNGKILTMTDARGVEMENGAEDRLEPVAGNDLRLTLDIEIQQYAQQLAYQTLEKKNAKKVSIIVMNPQTGGIYAMVNVPEFDLNDPFTPDQNLRSQALQKEVEERPAGIKKQELLNAMWRNTCINDTYEPGSTFKIITAAAGLEEGVVKLTDKFSCPGFRVVIDIGGQDTKGIVLKNGRVMKFVMNDKCSAGTGKFLEVMTNRLGLTQKELSQLASKGDGVTISSMCTVFAESEVISLIGKGTSREDIAYGVVESVAVKVAQLISQLDGTNYFLTGGLCEDEYMISRLSHALKAPVESMPLARYAGAIGAALLSGE